MGIMDKFLDVEKTSKVTIKDPRELYGSVLKQVSGTGQIRDNKFDIFYQIVAFKGVVEGVGCSTIVANTAIAVANLGLTVCVVDTSILNPVQDILLKTDYKSVEKDKRLDWFDMPYTKLSVLHESKLSKNISVLSFYGKDRTIIDMLSTNDSSELVDLAYTELHSKFDLILVDCCHEVSSVNTAALQQSQHAIQIWNDAPTVLRNVDGFINTCAALSCPLDKMRNVVYSKVMDDIIGNMDEVLNQYHLTKLTTNYFSKDVQRIAVLGRTLYQYASQEEDIINYTNSIIAIACHVCNIHDEENEPHGTVTSQQIMDGEVEGTYHKKLKDFNDTLAKNAENASTPADMAIAKNRESVPVDAKSIPKEIEKAKAGVSDDISTQNFSGDDFAPDDVQSNAEPKESAQAEDDKGKKKKKGLFGGKKG